MDTSTVKIECLGSLKIDGLKLEEALFAAPDPDPGIIEAFKICLVQDMSLGEFVRTFQKDNTASTGFVMSIPFMAQLAIEHFSKKPKRFTEETYKNKSGQTVKVIIKHGIDERCHCCVCGVDVGPDTVEWMHYEGGRQIGPLSGSTELLYGTVIHRVVIRDDSHIKEEDLVQTSFRTVE